MSEVKTMTITVFPFELKQFEGTIHSGELYSINEQSPGNFTFSGEILVIKILCEVTAIKGIVVNDPD